MSLRKMCQPILTTSILYQKSFSHIVPHLCFGGTSTHYLSFFRAFQNNLSTRLLFHGFHKRTPANFRLIRYRTQRHYLIYQHHSISICSHSPACILDIFTSLQCRFFNSANWKLVCKLLFHKLKNKLAKIFGNRFFYLIPHIIKSGNNNTRLSNII